MKEKATKVTRCFFIPCESVDCDLRRVHTVRQGSLISDKQFKDRWGMTRKGISVTVRPKVLKKSVMLNGVTERINAFGEKTPQRRDHHPGRDKQHIKTE